MALTAKETTEVRNELTEFFLTCPMSGLRALYINAGTAGYAALDALVVTEFSVVTENLFHETAPTKLP